MSYICFETSTESAKIGGLERHNFRQLVNGAFFASLGPIGHDTPFRRFIPGHLLEDCKDIEGRLRMLWGIGEGFSGLNGDDLNTIKLNSTLALGGDALKLVARLQGQMELYCYVEGEDRAWLASIIERACKDKILRQDLAYKPYCPEGWNGVIKLLRASSDGPVVCSYSVGPDFPGYLLDDEGDVEGRDDWSAGIERLRSEEHNYLRLSPAGWDSYRFCNETTGFDLRDAAYAAEKAAKEAAGQKKGGAA